jgi:hypothetical protein
LGSNVRLEGFEHISKLHQKNSNILVQSTVSSLQVIKFPEMCLEQENDGFLIHE